MNTFQHNTIEDLKSRRGVIEADIKLVRYALALTLGTDNSATKKTKANLRIKAGNILFNKLGFTRPQIIEFFETTYATIYADMKKYKGTRNVAPKAVDLDKVIEYYEAGFSAIDIATELGCNLLEVQNVIENKYSKKFVSKMREEISAQQDDSESIAVTEEKVQIQLNKDSRIENLNKVLFGGFFSYEVAKILIDKGVLLKEDVFKASMTDLESQFISLNVHDLYIEIEKYKIDNWNEYVSFVGGE